MTQEIIEMARESGLETQDGFSESVFYFAKLIAEREREECAKIADEWAVGWPHPSEVIAERIRARGQA
jgi:hypothetical protein